MQVLVAGGAGYIGSVTARRFAEEGHDVTVLDDLRQGHADAVGDLRLVDAPISQAGEVLGGGGFDLVVHLAADALVAESVAQPEKYWANNVTEGLALLEAMRTTGTPRIIFSSTCATYGTPRRLPITEDEPTAPINSYGMTKLAMDMALESYATAHGLAAISFRYFNVVGAYRGLTERHEPETHLVPNLLRGATGDSFTLYGTDFETRDGSAIRDYVHVVDLADAHLLALDALLDGGAEGRHEVLNLGTGDGATVKEVLAAVEKATGRTIRAVEAERRPGDPAELVADATRARERIGWAPRRSLEEAIADAWAGMDGA